MASEGVTASCILCLAVALIVFVAKAEPILAPLLPRRWQIGLRRWQKCVSHCPPEAFGLVTALVSIVMLRTLAPTVMPAWAETDKAGEKVWQDIQNEWPLLTTADTLLALQSFVRPLAVFSALWRSGGFSSKSISAGALPQETVWFFQVAFLARFTAFPLSGDPGYMIVGQAGGVIPVFFDVVTLTLLSFLSLHRTHRTGFVRVFVAVLVAAFAVACNNHMALVEDKSRCVADVAFAMASILELGAACAHLMHCATAHLVNGRGSVTAILVGQQLLATYFFVHVFPVAETWNAGKGFGYCIVTGGSVVQLGVWLLAFAVHIARVVDGWKDTGDVCSPRTKRRRPSPSECSTCSDDSPPQSPSPTSSVESSSRPHVAPQVLRLVNGKPLCCGAPKCRVNGDALMHENEEILEVLCSSGCSIAMHARCFRAASRAVRQHCTCAGCYGKVLRFRTAEALVEALTDTGMGVKS